MRRLLWLIPLLLCSSAFGAITALGGGLSCTSGTTACTVSANITAGDTGVVFGLTNTTGTTFTITDTDSDTFTPVTGNPFCEAAGNNCISAFVVNWGHTNATEVITFTCSASTNFMGGMALFYSGLGGLAAVDKTASTSYTATTSLITGTTATTSTANEALIAIFGQNGNTCGTFTQTGSWTFEKGQTLGSPNSAFEAEDQIVSATGTYQGTANSGSACTGGGWIITLQQGSTPSKPPGQYPRIQG